MRHLRFPIVAVLALAWAIPTLGQSPDPAKLAAVKARMQKFVDDGELAGAVTVFGNKAGIIQEEAVGFANLEAKTPMAKDTLFRIASMTKPITALAIMILADEGKLRIDDPVEKYLPEFKNQMMVASREKGTITLQKPSRPITLKDLLTHTSGLPGGYPAVFANVYRDRDRTLTETTLVISQQPLNFEPGSKWSYCNAGIDTLGRVVEVVSGEPYDKFLQKRIFDPLQMSDTTFFPSEAQLKRLATCYGPGKDTKLIPSAVLVVDYGKAAKHPVPAGGLFSTGADLARLYRCLLGKGQLGEVRIISEKGLAEMTKIHTGDLMAGFGNGMGFGLGFAVVKKPTDATEMLTPGTFGHGGAFGTQSWADPNQDLFFIFLIQRTGLKNGDQSTMRHDFQKLAVEAVKK